MKINNFFYGIVFFILISFSCNDIRKKGDDKISDLKINKKHSDSVCKYSIINKDSLLKIKKELLFKESDSCMFILLDRLKLMRDVGKLKYEKLNSIFETTQSSEVRLYFNSLMLELFYNDIENLSLFLFENKKAKILNPLIESLSMEIADSDNPKEKDIIETIKMQKNDSIQKYLFTIEKKLDSNLYN